MSTAGVTGRAWRALLVLAMAALAVLGSQVGASASARDGLLQPPVVGGLAGVAASLGVVALLRRRRS